MKTKNRFKVTFFTLAALIFFAPEARAEIRITEIMYNAPGSGSAESQDWIEVSNVGSSSVDLSLFKFFDGHNSSPHLIKNYESFSTVLPPSVAAILVSTPSKFKTEWPDFSGTVLDSSISLNTGATIGLKDENGNIIDSVSYSSNMGASNDGNTLQLSDGQWIAGPPTPGKINISSALNPAESPPPKLSADPPPNSSTTEQATAGNTQTPSQNSSSGSSFDVDPPIHPNAGMDRAVIVGAEVIFNGSALGDKKEPLLNARYLWNFGDGGIGSGQTATHIFRFPGEYAVVLDVASGDYSRSDIAIITAIDAKLSIGAVESGENGFIEIINKSNSNLDISGFKIKTGEKIFSLPKNTIIRAGKSIRFGNMTTDLDPKIAPEILYANGMKFQSLSVIVENKETADSVSNIKAEPISTMPFVSLKQNAPVVADVSEHNDAQNNIVPIVKKSQLWPYLLALFSLIGVCAAAIIIFRKNKNETEMLADKFDIVE